jgi:hypothetical protein
MNNQAQENLPDGEEQADERSLLRFPVPEDDPHEKEDMTLHVFPSPQEGQQNPSPQSDEKTNSSKTHPHSLHLYS